MKTILSTLGMSRGRNAQTMRAGVTLRHVAWLSIAILFFIGAFLTTASAQITPSGDAYTNSASPTTKYGTKTLLDVDGASQIAYIQFNLGSIPPGASITQATLKLYVNSVTAAGSFNVDYVNGAWSEGTIDWNNAPPLGAAIASSVPVVTADKNQYLLVNVTPAVQAWLNGGETNNGIALVANGSTNLTLDSKENTTTSHPAELDVVFASGQGTITGVLTGSGSGLMGGGTSGTLNLSLTNACSAGQVLSWNGSAWACTTVKGTGTVTSVGSGPGLTGGPITTSGTLAVDSTVVPLLAASNTFTTGQIINSSYEGLNVSAGAYGIVSNSGTAPGVSSSSTSSDGVDGYTGSSSAYGVSGTNFGGGGVGIYGAGGSQGAGVLGAISGSGLGVFGYSSSYGYHSAGVWGELTNESNTAFSLSLASGVWGDSGSSESFGVIGTADDFFAGYFTNTSTSGFPPLYVEAMNGASNMFEAYNLGTTGDCYIDPKGDLKCTGTKNAVVPVDGGSRTVALSAIESPKNWFEDFGSAQLVNGSALVALDTVFTQTVNTSEEYQVFLTPYGDCKGLYVSNRTANSFEVHELGGGSGTLSFGYRITALRRNYENVRFADATHDLDASKRMRERVHQAQPQSHDPVKNAVSRLTTATATSSPAGPARGATPMLPAAVERALKTRK